MTDLNTAMQATRGTWYQHDVSAAGWPIITPSTYYWIVVTPSTPLALTTQASGKYNGALWSGILDSTAPLPATTLADSHVFKARRLTSERFKSDVLFQASTAAGVNVLKNATNWGASGIDQRRVTSYDSSNVRYGIQLLGWQVQPTPQPSEFRWRGQVLDARRCNCTNQSTSMHASFVVVPVPLNALPLSPAGLQLRRAH